MPVLARHLCMAAMQLMCNLATIKLASILVEKKCACCLLCR